MNRKMPILSILFILLIALVSFIFHYPVHIENALTHQPEIGFGLEPSLWRTVFEPFLGLLLYFNRAFYAIDEFTMVLIWMIGFFFIYNLFQYGKKENKQLKKRFLLKQLFNMVLLVGIWFSMFVFIIFVELPNDRMVNKTSEWVLVTTHSHTDFSHDGLISEESLLKWHQRNGFDAFFITDHNNHRQTLEFVNSRLGKSNPDEPVVFCGEEFSGSNHLSLLGLKTNFATKGQPDSVVVTKARSEGAAILVNHWFDGEHKSLEYYRNLGVDGFEIENTATDKRYNREVYQRIRSFCESNNLIMNGGLDFHGYGSACTLWNAFKIPEWKNKSYQEKEEAVLNIIKTRDQDKLKVLLLNDRPYYDKKYLLFRPFVVLFTYFRTLNFLQVLSWACWILVFVFVNIRLNSKPGLAQKFTCNHILPLAGFVTSLFLVGLGLIYFSRIQHVEGFTNMYPSYGLFLCLPGLALLVLSGILVFFRNYKQKNI